MTTRSLAASNADTLSLDHMRAFIAFVETGSQARAARRLGVAQATVWRHVDRVQEHFGGGLFGTKTGAGLSARGVLVERTLRSVLSELESVRSRVSTERPVLRIGFIRIMRPLVENALREPIAQGRAPEFDVRLFELQSELQVRKLQSRELDIAICYATDELAQDRADVEVSLLTEQPYALVVPSHAFKRGKVVPRALHSLNYAHLPLRASREAAAVGLRWLKMNGVEAHHRVECKLGTEVIAYAASGRGYGFLPALWCSTPHEGAVFLPLRGFTETARIATYSLHHIAPRIGSFREALVRSAHQALAGLAAR